jgi:hypothetical protein
MPLMRNRDGFIEGGFAGIQLFEAVLTEVEEDIPNEFVKGKLRARIDFSDVELLEVEDTVTLDNDRFHFFFTQSDKRGSLNEKLIADYDDFALAKGIEGMVPESLKDKRLIYARKVVDFGKDMNPGKYWYPVGEAGDDLEDIKASLSIGGRSAPASKEDKISAATDFIKTEAELGTTLESLKAAVKAAESDVRSAVSAGGGLEKFVASLVETSILSEEDGVYTTV